MQDPRYEVENPRIKELVLSIGQILAQSMPPGFGFTLFIFGFKTQDLFYVSSANREDMIRTLKEFIAKEEKKV